MPEMKYRLLDPSEWDRLKEIVRQEYIPHPNSAVAAVAETDTGELVGVLFLQIALHMEPLVLKTPQASFHRLYETIYEGIKKDKGTHFYVFSDKEIVNKMAEFVGMKETSFKVWEGEVT